MIDTYAKNPKLRAIALAALATICCRMPADATIYAVTNGQWTSTATWGGALPAPADNERVQLRGSDNTSHTLIFDPEAETPGTLTYDYSDAWLTLTQSSLTVNSGTLLFERIESSSGGSLTITGGTVIAGYQSNPRVDLTITGGTYEILGNTNFKDDMTQSGGLLKVSQWLSESATNIENFDFSGGVVQVTSDTNFAPNDFDFVDDSNGILKVKSDNAGIFTPYIGDGSIAKDLSDVFVFGIEDIGGETYQTLSVAVPEPGVMTLLAVGSLLVVARRR